MTTPDSTRSAAAVAEHLRASRERIAGQWVHLVLGRREGAAVATRPAKRMLEAAPAIVDAVAEVISGEEIPYAQLAHGLRDVVESQRRRKHPLEAMLAELDLLGTLVFDAAEAVLCRPETSAGAGDSLHVGRCIHAALSGVGAVVATAYERAARSESREARGAMEEFVQTLSHELKNPLGAAELAAQMLVDAEIVSNPGEIGKYAEMIARNVRRGRALLDQMRDRVLLGSEALGSEEWVPLREVVDDVLHEVLPAAVEQDVFIALDELPRHLEVLGPAMRLVLMNLVWNAVKYSDPQKPKRWVRIRAVPGDAGGLWNVQVEDNGLGIPADAQRRIFERFFRVHPEVENGTGLGLPIAREAAEEIGGTLWVESEPGRGSTFVAAVPVRLAGEESATEDRADGREDRARREERGHG